MKQLYSIFLIFALNVMLAQEDGPIPLNLGKGGDVLTYAHPSEVGLDSSYIHSEVSKIITNGIKKKAFPGAQVLVAKNGKIIFHQAYGYHTYDSIRAVALNDIYDLASVTKITAALPALMKLVDEGVLDLDQAFSTYWKPWRKRKDKRDITLRQILAHQAGLEPYIVLLNTVRKKNGTLKKRFVRTKPNPRFRRRAYDNIYVKSRFIKKAHRLIDRSQVSDKKSYRYSGLAFLIFPDLIQQLTGQSFSEYLQSNFYGPIGLNTVNFNPKLKSYTNFIVPTEQDSTFRKALTHAWVHDENAALLGGVSGNAGLFASATDLAQLMQIYLQYGVYNGKRYFSKAVIEEFTRVQFPENDNRRGLGFDKPLLNNAELALSKAYPAPEVSPDSFGHSGFTGTFVWADPENQLVYIFLSNRVYPSRSHRQIYDLNIRPAVQQVFYQARLAIE
ncbi:serine hydrolase domain-containing protein [Zobellia galactanivorans]|nr:serine hydrolase [Zobellia galactanivorans]